MIASTPNKDIIGKRGEIAAVAAIAKKFIIVARGKLTPQALSIQVNKLVAI